MELLKYDAAWFLSEGGCNAFDSLKLLEDRAVFIYSYLKQITKAEFDQDQTLFKAAFFLADAVLGSSLPYGRYPDILDPSKNPFVTYLDHAEYYPGSEAIYYIFLSILHGVAEPSKRNEWIYGENMSDPECVEEKLTEIGKCFCSGSVTMASADAFAIEESLQLVQLKLIWLLHKK